MLTVDRDELRFPTGVCSENRICSCRTAKIFKIRTRIITRHYLHRLFDCFLFFCNPVFNGFQSCIPIVFSIGTLENLSYSSVFFFFVIRFSMFFSRVFQLFPLLDHWKMYPKKQFSVFFVIRFSMFFSRVFQLFSLLEHWKMYIIRSVCFPLKYCEC